MKFALLALTAAASAIVLAPSAHAQAVSDGTTAASGQTIVTMTMPKFAEVSGIPAALGFTVLPAEYGANATGSKAIGFKVRTNSTAGLTVQVAGSADSASELQLADVALTSDGKSGSTTLTSGAQTIWSNSGSIPTMPGSNNVNLGLIVNNLPNYTVTGATATSSQAYTKTLTFTVLPN